MEQWKDIEGYEGLYKVSTHGRAYSFSRQGAHGGLLKLQRSADGYLRVRLHKCGMPRSKLIHRLVAKAFIPNPENKPLVNHKDCNPGNNYVSNLEWATRLEDSLHAVKMGRFPSRAGSWGPNARLSEEDILEIRETYLVGGTTQRRLADLYDVSLGQICRILNRKQWKHI